MIARLKHLPPRPAESPLGWRTRGIGQRGERRAMRIGRRSGGAAPASPSFRSTARKRFWSRLRRARATTPQGPCAMAPNLLKNLDRGQNYTPSTPDARSSEDQEIFDAPRGAWRQTGFQAVEKIKSAAINDRGGEKRGPWPGSGRSGRGAKPRHLQVSNAFASIASPSGDFWNTILAMRLSLSRSGKSNQARVCIKSRLRATSCGPLASAMRK